MKFIKEYSFCRERLLRNVDEISEIERCIQLIEWKDDFQVSHNGNIYNNQAAYNKAFDIQFSKFDWKLQPILYGETPRLIGDYGPVSTLLV